ncbi:MAG: UbiX family flavin prenyltransferase [Candidatus Omnitrophica bacterium]|nr:UbiX family flavin prenyltransferase [Candidatus Omnitrophota bacterium]
MTEQPAKNHPIIVAVTGASGMPYGQRVIETLAESGRKVIVVVSDHARIVLKEEMSADFLKVDHPNIQFMNYRDIAAPIASGSFPTAGMIVCPCSMSTLGEIAGGISRNLIARAADVTVKEGRKLMLVPREMPFSAIHLENMLKLAKIGVTIMPASPGFYHHPKKIDDVVDFVAGKILDHFGIEHSLYKRWGTNEFNLEELGTF